MKIRLHYSKPGERNGLPWTLHTSRGCYQASHVVLNVPSATEEKPDAVTNPRYFVVCSGIITWAGMVATVVPAPPRARQRA